MSEEVTPRSAAKASAGPEKTRKGSPLSFLRISMLRQPVVLPMPVPKAFATASLPAKRAARCRSGNFIDIEYSISPSVKTRCRKRSPNRSIERWMRAHSITSTPIPITLMKVPAQHRTTATRKSDASTHRTPKRFARNRKEIHFFLRNFGSAGRPRTAFLSRYSSIVIGHSREHFLDRGFQADPRRARYDCVTDVEFAQIWNLVDERDVFVINDVTR